MTMLSAWGFLVPFACATVARAASILDPIDVSRPNLELFPVATEERSYPPAFISVSGPKETNKFWANWIVESGAAEAIYTAPWAMKWQQGASGPELHVSHGLDWQLTWGKADSDIGINRVRSYLTEFQSEFGLGAVESMEQGYEAIKDGLFGATFRVQGPTGTGRKIEYPLFSGMVYVSANYWSATPRIVADAITTISRIRPGVWKVVNGLGTEFRFYVTVQDGTLVDDTYSFDAQGNMNQQLNGWVRMAHVIEVGDEVILDQHADAVLIDMDLGVDANGVVSYQFTSSGVSDLLHFAYPHHLPLLSNRRAGMARSKAPTKGWMIAVVGNSWSMQVDLTAARAMTWLPHGDVMESKMTEVKDAVLSSWSVLKDSWKKEVLQASYYWSGKGFQKIGTVCLLLEKYYGIADANTQECLQVMADGFECYYKPSSDTPQYCDEAPQGSWYDDKWGGIASKWGFKETNCWDYDFGNSCFNDHHYHFGYFVVSAAILVEKMPSMKANIPFVSWINVLIRDTTNPSSLDPYFPRFRAFDWFDWHSWSRGVVPDAQGKDQESTSEEVNLLYGLVLWGRTMGNPLVESLGETMVSLEVLSIQQYFLMLDGNPNHPADFTKNHVTGIFFQNNVRYQTWFGTDPAFIHGIQMLPLTAPLQLTRQPAFCEQEWDEILTSVSYPPSHADYKWMSVILTGSLAFIRPAEAYQQLVTKTEAQMDSGLSRAYALYWTAIQPGIPPEPTITATVTSSTVMSSTTTTAGAGGVLGMLAGLGAIGMVLVACCCCCPVIAAIVFFVMMRQGGSSDEQKRALAGPVLQETPPTPGQQELV